MVAVGTVLIEHKIIDPKNRITRTTISKLWPVYCVPSITMYLLSTRQLLQSGLSIEGIMDSSITNGHLLICDWLNWYSKSSKKAKFRQWKKMLLSLRSNPQTMSPYIQNCDGLCTSTDHHLITTYCSTYGSVFVLEIVIT